MYSKEGITQGDPLLSMFMYGIGILPLICLLRSDFPGVEQPWYYTDDARAGRKFSEIRHFFHKLQESGSSFGYFPNHRNAS
jgi:hypothetical protein